MNLDTVHDGRLPVGHVPSQLAIKLAPALAGLLSRLAFSPEGLRTEHFVFPGCNGMLSLEAGGWPVSADQDASARGSS